MYSFSHKVNIINPNPVVVAAATIQNIEYFD
jgi:hypothetical protein